MFFSALHERKYPNEIVPSTSSNDTSLSLPLTTHSPPSKATENLARTIKPPSMDKKSERENKVEVFLFQLMIHPHLFRRNQRITRRVIPFHHLVPINYSKKY